MLLIHVYEGNIGTGKVITGEQDIFLKAQMDLRLLCQIAVSDVETRDPIKGLLKQVYHPLLEVALIPSLML